MQVLQVRVSALLAWYCSNTNSLDRTVHDANPLKWDVKINYKFSVKSSTTTLRPHIERYHLPIYMVQQKAHGWKILLPGLVSQAKSEAVAAVAQSQGELRPSFDEATFQRLLVNFIVADDQVCVCLFGSDQCLLFPSH